MITFNLNFEYGIFDTRKFKNQSEGELRIFTRCAAISSGSQHTVGVTARRRGNAGTERQDLQIDFFVSYAFKIINIEQNK